MSAYNQRQGLASSGAMILILIPLGFAFGGPILFIDWLLAMASRPRRAPITDIGVTASVIAINVGFWFAIITQPLGDNPANILMGGVMAGLLNVALWWTNPAALIGVASWVLMVSVQHSWLFARSTLTKEDKQRLDESSRRYKAKIAEQRRKAWLDGPSQ